MFKATSRQLDLSLFEACGRLVKGGHKRVEEGAQFVDSPQAASAQGLTAEDAEPDLEGFDRMNRRRVQVFYSGRVQGVGFRHQARQLAAGFEVTGMVRNLPDLRVELVAEGDEAEVLAYCEAIRASGLGPLIRSEERNWSEPKSDYHGFVIAR